MMSTKQAHQTAEECTPLLVSTSAPAEYDSQNNSVDMEDRAVSSRPESLETGIPMRFYAMLAVSVSVGLVSGTLYGYGRYARDLKQVLDLSQYEVQRLGILLDTGNYIGHPLTGYIYDHFGPQVSCLGSALIVFFAYGMIHVGVVDASRYELPEGALDLCFFLVGLGAGLGYIAALGSTAKIFSKTRSKSLAIAIVATGYGLCSTLVGISYQYLGLANFFIFWAIFVTVVNLVAAVVFGAWEDDGQDADEFSPVPLSEATEEEEDDSVEEGSRGNLLSESLVTSNSVRFEALRTTDFWMLFAAFASCTGCGLFVINNISLMVQSLGARDQLAGRLVILLSISNCAGRLIMGSLADRQSKLRLLSGASILMSLGLFLSALSTDVETARMHLVITVVTVAIAYGGLWVVIVAILSEWFGTHEFGTNYGVMAMGPALSGMVFNFLSAFLYERQAPRSVCLGTECYRSAFLLSGSAALMTSFLLWCLSHSQYSRQIKQEIY